MMLLIFVMAIVMSRGGTMPVGNGKKMFLNDARGRREREWEVIVIIYHCRHHCHRYTVINIIIKVVVIIIITICVI